MKRHIFTSMRFLLVLMVLAGAGCGGSGSTTSSTPSAPTPTPSPTSGATAVWRASPNAGFRILGASTPNAGLVGGEVWLTVGSPQGSRLYRSRDGSNQSTPEVITGLATSLDGTGYAPSEVVPRQNASGGRELYVLGLAPPASNRAWLFRLQESGGAFVRNPSRAVYEGLPDNQGFVGVPDVYRTTDGRTRLIYVEKGAPRQNARTAISSDQGASFTLESTNPFGDINLSGAVDTNVDPAVLALASGGYIAVTMRATKLYIFTSADGLSFTAQSGSPIEATSFVAGATGLFDPTLVQLADGTVLMYATLEDAQRQSSVVQAMLLR